jgi:hypothetical protein
LAVILAHLIPDKNIAPNGGKHSAKRPFLVRQTGVSSAPNGPF